MPWQDIMHKFGKHKLHSGSKSGPKVKNRKQALAIMMSEKKSGEGLGPSKNFFGKRK